MHFIPSTSTGKTFLALLVVTGSLHVAARTTPPVQFNLVNTNAQAPIPVEENHNPQLAETGSEPENDSLKTTGGVLSYGNCYYLTNPKGEHLGSDGGVYSYLKFGSNNHRRPFRLCRKSDGGCSKRGDTGLDKGKFWLQDYQGSYYAKGKNTIAGNEYGYLYPSFAGWTNYLHFKAYNDCDLDEGGISGECYVRLKLVDEKNNYNGLEVNGAQYPYLSLNQQQTLTVQFHQVNCPTNDDEYDL